MEAHTTDRPKLTFPQIERVEFEGFSLYDVQPDVGVPLPDGVFCLAGANGLGKSTFLSAVNFALTGIVPDPDREFRSVTEYVKFGAGFSNDYFTGRIDEDDRDRASVTLVFRIGTRRFRLTRGVFEGDRLRALRVTEDDGVVVYDTASASDGAATDGERALAVYEEALTQSVGLHSFAQFVFFQHFVLTFDEARHLILWDRKVLTQVLYIAVGTDYEVAARADKLRRAMERADSVTRNRNYAATNVRGRIEQLQDVAREPEGSAPPAELRATHQALTSERDRLRQEVEQRRERLEDAELAWGDTSAAAAAAEHQYERAFADRTAGRAHIEYHPIVKATLEAGACAVCATPGPAPAARVRAAVEAGLCPLCETELAAPVADDAMAELVEADRVLAEARNAVREAAAARDRVSAEVAAAEAALEAQAEALRTFEGQNDGTPFGPPADDGVQVAIARLREERAELIAQKNEARAKRDKIKAELMGLQRGLQLRYTEVEEEFVPLFKQLATLFIGIDLDVRMDANTSTSSHGLSLTLEMRGQARRETYQMSESQRFFLDIALRMALAEFTSASNGPASLLVDTPEGSLDIAYESRAGRMFADFAKAGHDIIMTANINSSEILIALAQECGADLMRLHRMTSWAGLSEVQEEGEHLFDAAYERIAGVLASSGDGQATGTPTPVP